jgi:hypothetical protein
MNDLNTTNLLSNNLNQGECMDLREQFEKETGTRWINSQNEPDIDYVCWLETKLNGVIDALKKSDCIDENKTRI